MKDKPEPRDRKNPIKVFVSPTERARIQARATQAGMPLSAFMRSSASGAVIKNVLDLKAVRTLAEVNREQAGIVKAIRSMGWSDIQVKEMLQKIEIVQARLIAAAQKIKT